MHSRMTPETDLKTFFDQMVSDYSPMLYAHIRTIVLNHDDADDVLQETLIKAWFGLPRFRSGAAVSTWLYRIATNEALGFLRRQRWKQWIRPVESLKNDPVADIPATEDAAALLQQALKLLSVQQRKIFGLRYFNETPFREIAEILGLAEGTVKATYHQSVKKIESYLSTNFENGSEN